MFSVQYAEFLENEKKDIVTADSLYSKVLKRDPTNEAALLRHQVRVFTIFNEGVQGAEPSREISGLGNVW